MIYKGQKSFHAVVWFYSSPTPSPHPVSKLSFFLSLPASRRSSLLTRERRKGVAKKPKSYVGEKARSSINHSILSLVLTISDLPHSADLYENKEAQVKPSQNKRLSFDLYINLHLTQCCEQWSRFVLADLTWSPRITVGKNNFTKNRNRKKAEDFSKGWSFLEAWYR